MTKWCTRGSMGLAILLFQACSSSPSDVKPTGGTVGVDPGGNTPGSGGRAGADTNPSGGTAGIEFDENGLALLADVYPAGFDALVKDACQGVSAEVEKLPISLEIVVDVSTSMNLLAPGSQSSKWVVTREALRGALGELPGTASVGLTFYPNQATESRPYGPEQPDPPPCVLTKDDVPIASLGEADSAQRLALGETLDRVQPPGVGAGTPTHDAYVVALTPLEAVVTKPEQKFMLLITDGQPTFSRHCVGWGAKEYPVDPAPIVQEIGAARRSSGIRTFVIGSPGSEEKGFNDKDSRSWLSDAAIAGGTSSGTSCSGTGPTYCHFDMTTAPDFATALGNALGDIASTMVPCSYTVAPPGDGRLIDPSKVEIVYTEGGTSQTKYLLAASDDPVCPAGWRFTDEGKTQIEICGKTCEKLQSDIQARVDLLFDCQIPNEPPR